MKPMIIEIVKNKTKSILFFLRLSRKSVMKGSNKGSSTPIEIIIARNQLK